MRQFVTVRALGIVKDDTDEIMITALGSRGGTRAVFGITPGEATALIENLKRAVAEYRK